MIERSTPKGSYICHHGDWFDHWTGLINGPVKVEATSSSGKAMNATYLHMTPAHMMSVQ